MFHEATPSDAEKIARLVNLAYRPIDDDSGWTHESKLVSGQRINTEKVLSLMREHGSILVAREEGTIFGCVHIAQAEPHCEIGMLATMLSQQNKGIGKKLLAAAEEFAIFRYGAQGFKISVLSSRPELLAYYERRGYRLTGATQPYPAKSGFGQPLEENLQVLDLSKTHRAPA